MTDPVSEFLVTHRTTAKWLDDIIDVLLDQPRGTAHVGVLADKLWRSEKRDVASIEQTITRSINNYCSDAADFNKTPAHDLFQRVEPGTYRLRSFPEKPNNIYELTAIRFDDRAMQYMWELFSTTHKQVFAKQWKAATNRRKLERFVKWMSDQDQLESYESQKNFYRDIEGGLPF